MQIKVCCVLVIYSKCIGYLDITVWSKNKLVGKFATFGNYIASLYFREYYILRMSFAWRKLQSWLILKYIFFSSTYIKSHTIFIDFYIFWCLTHEPKQSLNMRNTFFNSNFYRIVLLRFINSELTPQFCI